MVLFCSHCGRPREVGDHVATFVCDAPACSSRGTPVSALAGDELDKLDQLEARIIEMISPGNRGPLTAALRARDARIRGLALSEAKEAVAQAILESSWASASRAGADIGPNIEDCRTHRLCTVIEDLTVKTGVKS